jgi:hypothetical protein
MRNAKTLMVALLAVFAFSAIAATVASATLPEYSGSTAKEFGSESGVAKLKMIGGITVICKSSIGNGSMNTNASTKKAGTVTVTFRNCTASGEECHSTAPAKSDGSGEIETNSLNMELGYIATGLQPKVGELLTSTAGKKAALTTFECKLLPDESIVVTGGVIGEITPINVLSNTFELAFDGSSTEVLKTSVGGMPAVESVLILENPAKITLLGGAKEGILG